jgi:tellurite resistance protein
LRFPVPAAQRAQVQAEISKKYFALFEAHLNIEKQIELDREAQEEALQLMLDAAVADGKVFYQERSYLYEVGSAMGLSSAEMDKRISERLAQPRE